MRKIYYLGLIAVIFTSALNAYPKKITEENGRVWLIGNQLCNENGNPIKLHRI